MGKLISFEFRKIIRQKSFYICFAIVLGLIILSAAVNNGLKDNPDFALAYTVSGFTKSAFSSSSFLMILGVFIALYCCDDISNNTLKNLYSRGYTRGQVYFSKYVVSLVMSVAMAALSFLVAFVIGKSTAESDGAKIIGPVVCQIALVVAYHAVYFSLATVIGKVGGSVAINIMGPMLVLTVLTLITSLLKFDSVNLGDYWLESAMNGLTAGEVASKAYIKAVVMTVLYSAAFIPTGYVLNKKKEL